MRLWRIYQIPLGTVFFAQLFLSSQQLKQMSTPGVEMGRVSGWGEIRVRVLTFT